MYFEEIGHRVRVARKTKGMTQIALAQAAGLSRTTINQLESGAFPDIGVKKLLSILEVLGLDLALVENRVAEMNKRDYLEFACISANVSYRGELKRQELANALVTGKVPGGKRPQLRVVFDELPQSIFDGMIRQVSAWCPDEKLSKNISTIAMQIDSSRRAAA